MTGLSHYTTLLGQDASDEISNHERTVLGGVRED
jgi:hypothetical protein